MERVSGGDGCSRPLDGEASRPRSEPSRGELQLRAGGRLLEYECRRQRAGEAGAPRAAWCTELGEASGCRGNQEEEEEDVGPRPKGRGKRKAAEVSERRPAEQKRRRRPKQQRRRKRPPRDKGLPLKRTYGDTRVDRRLLAARRLASAPPQQQKVWAQAQARGRGRGQPAGPWEPMLRGRGCRTVSLSDAQTQTESGTPSSSCSEPSTSESGLDRSPTPGEEESSSSSPGSPGSSSRDSSQLSVAQAACPPASPLGHGGRLQAGPRLCPDGSRAGGRRRPGSPTSPRPGVYSGGPRRRRRSVPGVRDCSPQGSQDGWGCLIF
ncbi:synapsin-1-like [Pristis pectinata]|uniref:synapsin-1-like n=1 Tax=Pristis pectinata TaxID=685728 RepID=UPI00223DB30E|nr:synapsin-1-like [Pristis pectinata]